MFAIANLFSKKLCLVIAFVFLFIAPESQAQQKCYSDNNPSDCYGAIAFSVLTGHWGTSSNINSKRNAKNVAYKRCRQSGAKDCKVVLDFHRYNCGALATAYGQQGGGVLPGYYVWGTVWGDPKEYSQRLLSRSAEKNCEEKST